VNVSEDMTHDESCLPSAEGRSAGADGRKIILHRSVQSVDDPVYPNQVLSHNESLKEGSGAYCHCYKLHPKRLQLGKEIYFSNYPSMQIPECRPLWTEQPAGKAEFRRQPPLRPARMTEGWTTS